MPVGAAIAGSAALSAGVGVYSANKAANAQKNAANQATATQMQMYNTTRDDLAPYRAMGTAALPAVYQLLGLAAPSVVTSQNTGSKGLSTVDLAAVRAANPGIATEYQRASAAADKNSPMYTQQGLDSLDNYTKYWYDNIRNPSDYTAPGDASAPAAAGAAGGPLGDGTGAGMQAFLANTPGYQFQLQQGTQGVNNALTARGLGGLSGSLGKGLAKYITGLADSTYQQQLGNYMNLVNGGASAANQTGGYGTTTGGNVAQTISGAGAATASGYVGGANAVSGAINGGVNGYLTSKYLSSANPGGIYGSTPSTIPAAPQYTGATDLLSNAG